eukprot:1514699-Rhodomonas_salina.1
MAPGFPPASSSLTPTSQIKLLPPFGDEADGCAGVIRAPAERAGVAMGAMRLGSSATRASASQAKQQTSLQAGSNIDFIRADQGTPIA